MSRHHDILISSAVLIAFAPVYLLMALLIKVENHAFPFIGVTRIGRLLKTTGLEALPAFYNVLIENMALKTTALLR